MKIILSNIIRIEDPTKEVLEYCKQKLTYTNPQYSRIKAMGYSVYKVPKDIKLYNVYEGSLYVPYGFFEDLWKIHPIADDYVDYTTKVYANITSKMTLRDYQVPCIRAIKEHGMGIFNVITGLGKTNMGLECVAQLKQKTLWITHSGDLLNQSRERAMSTLNCTTSTITEGKCDLSGDIVFATVQTLIKYVEKESIPQNTFGMTITDECHKCSCNPKSMEMFRKCIEWFSASYRLGLSASLWRSDGLAKCIENIIGHPIYTIRQSKDNYVCEYNGEIIMKFSSDKFSVRPKIIVKETKYSIEDKEVYSKNGGTIEFASLISDLANDKERNKLILKDLKKMKEPTIVLSDRITQLDFIKNNLEGAVLITGDTPKKERTIALEQVRNGEKQYLLASFNLAKEGLDVKNLVNLVLATPVKAESAVVQSIGRIMRTSEGKTTANVYDYVDSNVGMLLRFYTKRRAIYRKCNYEIENMYLGG